MDIWMYGDVLRHMFLQVHHQGPQKRRRAVSVGVPPVLHFFEERRDEPPAVGTHEEALPQFRPAVLEGRRKLPAVIHRPPPVDAELLAVLDVVRVLLFVLRPEGGDDGHRRSLHALGRNTGTKE